MPDKLIEIERHSWPALRDLYERNSPATFLGHNLVDNFIRWTDQQPDFPNLVFYSLNGDWSDGTFAAIHIDFLYTYSLAGTSERLRSLLLLIDFSKGLKIHSIMSRDRTAIQDVIKSKKLQLKFDTESLLHYLPSAEALKFDLTPPDDLTMKSIEQSDVHIADAVWFYRKETENTLQFLQQLAKFNPNVGAYDCNGRMIAWVFRLPSGLLGALQVDQEFYGRGLGLLVSKWLSRKIAEMGHDIGATVFERNTYSLAIFKKLGFTIVDRVYWTDTLPI